MAVQKARNAAAKVEAYNALRQTLIASHSFAISHGHLPDIDGSDIGIAGFGESAFLHLFYLMEGHREAPPKFIRFRSDPSIQDSIHRYTPTGPMLNATYLPIAIPPHLKVTSIALNPLVYLNSVKFSHFVTDGTSSTIILTEHFGSCSGGNFEWSSAKSDCYNGFPVVRVQCSSGSDRRPTFADGRMFQDVVPVTIAGLSGPITHGSSPLTFQVRPSLEHCDPRIPQSTFAGGILCGMADGSVRFVRQDISESIFWGSVTPDKGEIAPLD